MARAVRNVIFDLGGVVLEWNPDHIVSRFQPVPELQASLKAALFGHADWRLFYRGTLTESEFMRALQGQGTPLYCLSNMPATVCTHLRQRHNFWMHLVAS